MGLAGTNVWLMVGSVETGATAQGDWVMASDMGAPFCVVRVHKLVRWSEDGGLGSCSGAGAGGGGAGASHTSPGIEALRRSLSFALAARNSVL